jgi:hypothetical protein
MKIELRLGQSWWKDTLKATIPSETMHKLITLIVATLLLGFGCSDATSDSELVTRPLCLEEDDKFCTCAENMASEDAFSELIEECPLSRYTCCGVGTNDDGHTECTCYRHVPSEYCHEAFLKPRRLEQIDLCDSQLVRDEY